MGTGTVGNFTRGRVTAKRTAALTILGVAIIAGALLFPFNAPAHDASDFFMFARTLHGPAAETNCNGSSNNNKQAEISGSTNVIHGRIHSNADYHAGGQDNEFFDAVTFGTEDTDCAGFAGGNTYNDGPPTDLNGGVPSGVNSGWPGDLNSYVDNGWEIDNIGEALPGETCDVGSLSTSSDYTVTAADNGKVICRGTGKVQLNISNVTLAITILSHGPIEISGQNVTLTPAAHGILAFTDYKFTDYPIKLAGSNFAVPVKSILFATKAGIDTSGSDDSEMCIQLIAQGWIKVPGSNNILGPGSSACVDQTPGKIVIEKQTDPANYSTTFNFTGEIVATLADNQTAEKSVPAGTYTVTESEKTFWDVYSIVCNDANSTGDLGLRRATFRVEAGETVKCTFFNRKRGDITVVKQTNPDGETQSFPFSASYDADGFSLTDNQSNWSGALVPGTYSVSETVPDGWLLESATCDDGSPVNAIQLAPTEDITCTFVNTKKAKVIVKKVMVGGTASFPFTGTPSGSISTNNGTLEALVAPGQYVSTEGLVTGWDLTNVTCDDQNSVGSVANHTATFNVTAGEVVTCTFTNQKRSTIVVEKLTVGGNGTFAFDGPGGFDPSLGNGETAQLEVLPGTHTVSETVPSGWDLTGIVCDDGQSQSPSSGDVPPTKAPGQTGTATYHAEPGETVKCTFTNTKRPDVTVVKTGNGMVTAGETATFTITITNNGPGTATGVSLNDPLPGSGWSIDSQTGTACGIAADVLSCSGIELPEDGTYTVVVSKTTSSADCADLVNTVRVDAENEHPQAGGNNTSSDTVVVNCPDIEVEKTGNGTISAGEQAVFEITITNNGTGTATDVELEDTLVGGGWSIVDQTTESCEITAGVLSCDGITILEGGQFVVTVARATSNTDCAGIVNTVVVSAGNEDPDAGGNNSDTATIVVDCPDVTVTKLGNGTVSAGETATFTVTITNDGPGTATGVFLNDPLPGSGWEIVSQTADDCGIAADVLTCSGITLLEDASYSVVVSKVTTTADCADLVNTATVGAGNEHPQAGGNNTATDTVVVNCPDVTVSKTGNGTVSAGETATFTIVITNDGPGTATGVSLEDTLVGGGWTIDNQTGTACEIELGVLSCSGITLLEDGTYTVVVSKQTSNENCGSIVNTVEVSAGNEDPNAGGNNEDSATIVVDCPDITVEKTGNGTISAGETATFTIVVTNNGPGTATGVGLTDDLPGSGWEILSQTGESCVLDQAGENLTCSGITLTPSGEGSTYSVTVRRATVAPADCGPMPNTAEVSAENENPQATGNNSDSDTITVRCAGTIIIKKQTIPVGSGTEFPFTFEEAEDSFSLAHGEQEAFEGLDPGSYTFTEDVPEGWDLEAINCGEAVVEKEGSSVTIDLGANETVICTFVNEQDSEIIVEKQTIPNGDPTEFEFGASWTEGVFTLSDGERHESGDLEPGQYAVGEDVPLGWDLTDIDCGEAPVQSEGSSVFVNLGPGETVTCVFTNTKRPPGSINVIKTASPTTIQEPGGTVNYTVTVQNTSTVDVTITQVVDDRFGNLANVAGGNPAGCFAVPFVLAPGASSTCTFPKELTGAGGTSHINVVTVTGTDTSGNTLTDSDDARVDFTPRLIDLVIVKNATSPTPLNGIVTYSMTVTNKGPDTATNVQLVDPAPAGITYLTVSPGSPTCTLTPSLITCSLGTLAAGQSRSITVTARATLVGRHTNTATVTGEGGRETNPADNVDNAVTVVPAPIKPPVVKPKPEQAICLTLTVNPKMIKADGKPDLVRVKVTAGTKRVKGTKVVVRGAGIKKSTRSNAKGVASLRVNPRRPGVITITAVESKNQKVCGPKRIGAVGVFLPPLTG